MDSGYITVKDFIAEWRANLGDTTQEVPQHEILAFLNKALRRLLREKGVDKLNRRQDTFEMASVNSDGTPSASWILNQGPSMIINLEDVVFLNTNGAKVKRLCPRYMPIMEFRQKFPVPEANSAGGNPSHFTFFQVGGKTKLIFSCPIDMPYIMDIIYTAFHKRIKSVNDVIEIPYDYLDIVTEAVTIFYNMEAADAATARALYEDYDKLVAEARELLAQQHTAAGNRIVKGAI